MTNWTVVYCPHCGELNLLDVNPRKMHVMDVHVERKAFTDLDDRESEQDYICNECEQTYYVTMRRSSRLPFYGTWFFLNKEKPRRTG